MTAGFAETGPVGDRDGTGSPQVGPPTRAWPAYPPTSGFPAVPPPAQPRRGRGLTVLVWVLVVLVLGQAAYLVYLNTRLADADRRISNAASQNARANDELKNRIAGLEKQASRSMDVSAVSAAVLPSVFRIDVPEGTATAFAINRPAGGGTDLLTNYHVVQGLWAVGKRDAAIEHDNERFTVHIVRVDQTNDLALLHADQKFPALVRVPNQVSVGTSVVLIGAPLGLTQSVTSGVVSAIRTDIPGDAGKTFIQFDAAINPGNSGGPVVNAQKQVVGVAAAKANGAEGIGLAIPISIACQSFSGIC